MKLARQIATAYIFWCEKNVFAVIVIIVINNNFYCAHYKKNALALQWSTIKAQVKM